MILHGIFKETPSSGTPLVLLHAFPLSSGMWNGQIEHISKETTVIAPDFRGYGSSTSTPQNFSFALFAQDVRETLASLNCKRAVFAGCYMGGYTIFELWRQAPELFAGMILCDTRAEPDTDEGRTKRAEQIRLIREKGPDFMQYFVAQNLLSEKTRRDRPQVVAKVKELVAGTPAETMIATLQALADRPDSGPTLSTINVPTLVLVGENDTVTPLPASERLAREIPGAKLEIIPEAGHLTPLETQEDVTRLLSEFLKRFSSATES